MYASNLQELLFHCSERSDLSPQAFAEFAERFNELRSYGHLPKGRDQRKQLLTPIQVASAILESGAYALLMGGAWSDDPKNPLTCRWC